MGSLSSRPLEQAPDSSGPLAGGGSLLGLPKITPTRFDHRSHHHYTSRTSQGRSRGATSNREGGAPGPRDGSREHLDTLCNTPVELSLYRRADIIGLPVFPGPRLAPHLRRIHAIPPNLTQELNELLLLGPTSGEGVSRPRVRDRTVHRGDQSGASFLHMAHPLYPILHPPFRKTAQGPPPIPGEPAGTDSGRATRLPPGPGTSLLLTPPPPGTGPPGAGRQHGAPAAPQPATLCRDRSPHFLAGRTRGLISLRLPTRRGLAKAERIRRAAVGSPRRPGGDGGRPVGGRPPG